MEKLSDPSPNLVANSSWSIKF